MADEVKIFHPETKGTATIKRVALAAHQKRGWQLADEPKQAPGGIVAGGTAVGENTAPAGAPAPAATEPAEEAARRERPQRP